MTAPKSKAKAKEKKKAPAKKATPETVLSREFKHFTAHPIGKLIPNPENPRKHTDDEIMVLVKNIKRFGFTNPILFQKKTGIIIAGHGRYKAAVSMHLPTVPAISWDIGNQDAMAHMLADNRLGELSVWDIPRLKNALAELDGHGYDIRFSGFNDLNVDVLLSTAEEVSFLKNANLDEENGDGEEKEQGDATGENVAKLTFALTAEDREAVLGYLQAYAETNQLAHTAAALVHLTREQ